MAPKSGSAVVNTSPMVLRTKRNLFLLIGAVTFWSIGTQGQTLTPGGETPIELRGLFDIGAGPRFCLVDTSTGEGIWVGLGERSGPYEVTGYDPETRIASVSYEGNEYRLRLQDPNAGGGEEILLAPVGAVPAPGAESRSPLLPTGRPLAPPDVGEPPRWIPENGPPMDIPPTPPPLERPVMPPEVLAQVQGILGSRAAGTAGERGAPETPGDTGTPTAGGSGGPTTSGAGNAPRGGLVPPPLTDEMRALGDRIRQSGGPGAGGSAPTEP